MGSATVPAAARAGQSRTAAHVAAAIPIRPNAPIARPRLSLCTAWSRPIPLRHVEDVTAPEPERTRRLPLHEIVVREPDALRLAVRLLPDPVDVVAAELGLATRERDRLDHVHRSAQGEPARLRHLTEHEHARAVDLADQ